MSASLWDVTGIDALAVMMEIFGEAVGRLAPFQSLETRLAGQDCSILRLCDRTFRIADAPTLPQHLSAYLNPSPQAHHLYLHQFDWLGRIGLPAQQLTRLATVATVRPPHRLRGLPGHCAVPIQIADLALLLWHHPRQEQLFLECHVARQNLDRLPQLLPPALATQLFSLEHPSHS